MATPEEMAESMIRNLNEKTGKTLEEWLKIVKAAKIAKHGEIVKHLKGEFGIGHGYANMIAQHALGGDIPAEGDALVDAQYAGAKAALRPIYESLIAAIRKLGADAEVSPKKTYVSLRRSKQFALIQPTTATRIDIGINLKGVPATNRLEAAGSFNAMVSHRVRLEKISEIDEELVGWLKCAYEAS